MLFEHLRSTIASLQEIIDDQRTGDLYLNVQAGSYRIIPVQPTLDVIPLKMEPTGSTSIPSSTDKPNSANGSIIQSLASGIAQYGRTLTNRMSLVGSSTNKSSANISGNAKPLAMTHITNRPHAADENNTSEASQIASSIKVDVSRISL
jgi:hypothetical protein